MRDTFCLDLLIRSEIYVREKLIVDAKEDIKCSIFILIALITGQGCRGPVLTRFCFDRKWTSTSGVCLDVYRAHGMQLIEN